MISNVDIWSNVDQKIVSWTLNLEDEDNGSKVIVVRYGKEFLKFSPNCSDEEIQKEALNINKEH